jgi:plastocyanin
MKKLLLTTALMLAATPAFAKEYTIKEVTSEDGKYYFEPKQLTIQPGDTVTFLNAQDDIHDVMFGSVPKKVDEMIMSPQFEKKGEKFSYTFTVPGTYQFHCHPHEELGMKGTLIVGTPSKPGETKKVSHHDMAAKLEKSGGAHAVEANPAAGGDVQATGQVVSVDAAKNTIKLKHDPIKALNWPTMTMNFTAESGVDLSGVQAGDAVTFTLKPQGKDDYVINSLKKK